MGRPGQKAKRLEYAAQHPVAFRPENVDGGHLPSLDEATPEDSYCRTASLEHRRQFAQFFTPPQIAAHMAEWVLATDPKDALDPACGAGIFARSLLARKADIDITAIDVDTAVLAFARKHLLRLKPDVRLIQQDFLHWRRDVQFDAILLNPPYLRHRDYSGKDELLSRYGAKAGLALSRLSNIYVFFIIEACLRLREGGRAAILVPVEWTNANFGDPLKSFLLGRGYLKAVTYFDHAQSVFPDALTTACVLKIENSPAPARISMEKWRNGNLTGHPVDPQILLKAKKWETAANQDGGLVPAGFVPLQVLATTRRGTATGANDFFLPYV